MTNEIYITSRVTMANGFSNAEMNVSSLAIDQSAVGKEDNIQIIGTTEEIVTLGDVSVPGVFQIRSVEPAAGNFVTVGVKPAATYYPLIKLLPGEPCNGRFENVVIYAKADTATVKIQKLILET